MIRFAAGKWFAVPVLLTLFSTTAFGQTLPVERTLHASKSTVEAALRKIPAAAGGRLPTLDGFVTAPAQPIERFQRPHFTYSVQVASKSASEAVVKVRAHVTAWYSDPITAQSRYRELDSNGRLETDLCEQLEEQLGAGTVKVGDATEGKPAGRSVGVLKPSSSNPLFATPRPGAVLPPRTEVTLPTQTRDSANYAQALKEQAANLEEVLRNQTHPLDLAAVKKSKTPVFSRPSEQGDVLFLAEAQDEFQILNTSSEWVHVQISGLSRGWILGADLELPSRQSPKPAAISPSPLPLGATTATKPFRLARQEVNTFPGDWAPLRGKSVRILSLEPAGDQAATTLARWESAKEMFRRATVRLDAPDSATVEGVVLIFDSADGGMAAATRTSLQEWNKGDLSDDAFRAQCSLDPPEAFPK